MIKIRVEKGQEVMATLTEECKKRDIKNAAIVTLFGAVDECCISTMPKEDAMSDILTEYKEPLELSGTGEIADGKPHVHCTLGRQGDIAITGHLHWGKVQCWFINAYLIELVDP